MAAAADTRVIPQTIATEIGAAVGQVAAAIGLLDEGAAVLSRLTSSTAWWVQTDAPEGMKLMMRRGLEKTMEGDFETDSMRYKATERYDVGFTDWRAMYGTPGV